MSVLANKQVWLLAVVYCGSSATSNALSLWMPQILKSFGLSNLETGLLNMIPFGIASVFMILWGLRADRSGERIWNTALPLALTSLSFAATLLTGSLTVTLVLLSLVRAPALPPQHAYFGSQSHTPSNRCLRFGPRVTATPARLAPVLPARL